MDDPKFSEAASDGPGAVEVDCQDFSTAEAAVVEFIRYAPTPEELRKTRLGAINTAMLALPLLSRVDEYWLAVKSALGDTKARDKLIRHHARFVLWVARRYEGRGLLLEDLMQEGMAGLLEAVARFEPWRGHKLITYASWWVRHHLQRAIIDTGKTIRVPVYAYERHFRLRRVVERAALQGMPVDDEDCAHQIGGDPREARRVGEMLAVASLHAVIGSSEDWTFEDVLASPERDDDAVRLTHPELLARPESLFLFSRMPPRHREILFLYLLGWTERAIGARFYISPERARQQIVTAANYARHRGRMQMRRELGAREVSYLCQALVVAVTARETERLTKAEPYREWIGRIEGLPAPGVVQTLCRRGLIAHKDETLMQAYLMHGEAAAARALGRKSSARQVRQRALRIAWLQNQLRFGYSVDDIVNISHVNPLMTLGPPTALYEILGEPRCVSHASWFTEHRRDTDMNVEEAECEAREALRGQPWERDILMIAAAHGVPLYMLMGKYRHGGVTAARREAACKLVYEFGISHEVTARVLGVSPGSMKWLLPRAQGGTDKEPTAAAKIA